MSVGLLQTGVPQLARGRLLRSYPASRHFVLFALCLLWFWPGIVDRAPWKPLETLLVPVIAESLAGDIWTPVLLGEPHVATPPLYLAIAGFAAKAFSQLAAHEAMRLPNFIWLLAGLALAGLAVGRLHGSRAGWRVVLLVMGSPLLLLHARTVNPAATLVLIAAAGMLGLAVMRRDAIRGGLLLGSVGAVGFWLAGWVALWFVLFLLAMPLLSRSVDARAWLAGCVLAGGATIASATLWLLLIDGVDAALPAAALDDMLAKLAPTTLAISLQRLLLAAAWGLWPAMPLAVLAVVNLRHRTQRSAEQVVALHACLAAIAACVVAGGDSESQAIITLVPAAMLATSNLATMSRDIVKALDWFAIIVLGIGVAGFIWLAWLAAATGIVPPLAAWVASQGIAAPAGVDGGVAAAVVVTATWIALMLRIGRSPERMVINWMAGLTTVWLLFCLLWLPEVDKAKSYAAMAAQLAEVVPAGDCVRLDGVSATVGAQLGYFSGLAIVDSASGPAGASCPWILASADAKGVQLWSGRRSTDDEADAVALFAAR